MSTIDTPLSADPLSPPKGPVPGNRSRLASYSLRAAAAFSLIAFLSFCAMWLQWQAQAPGVSKVSGDFVSFWTAGRLALAGHAADAYHEMPHYFTQLALHQDLHWGYVGFFYPPFFLLLCAALALLSYFPALCLWLAATCAGYAAALRGLLNAETRNNGPLWMLCLGYPAVMVNAGFGQNGFLSTALFATAAVWLDRRPALAGLCLGGLAYKPQLGIVVPLALAVAGRWRCFAAASATVLALAAVATLAFGTTIWPAFFVGMASARREWLQPYNLLDLRYFPTVYAMVRLHGGSLVFAYAAQAAAGVAALAGLLRALWRRSPAARSGAAEIAAIAACVPFCSPYLLEYDLLILAVPMAWLLREALRDGFRRGEGLTLLAAYLAPILFKVSRIDLLTELGVLAAAALLFAAVLRRMTPAPAMA